MSEYFSGTLRQKTKSSGGSVDPTLVTRLETLENGNEIYEIYENINATSGSVTVPTNATILLDRYDGAGDCLIVKNDSEDRPVDEGVLDTTDSYITSTFDASGNYSLSGTPESGFPVSIVYQVLIQRKYSDNIDTDAITNVIDVYEADEITLDNSVVNNIPIYTVQDGLNFSANTLLRMNSTGASVDGVIAVNGGDSTKFDIVSTLTGYVIDRLTNGMANPIVTLVTIPAQSGISVTNIATQNKTYIVVNKTGNIIQRSTKPSPEDRHDFIELGVLSHVNNTNIDYVSNNRQWGQDQTLKISDAVDAIGTIINVSGNKYTANGANLSINRSSGEQFGMGVNYPSVSTPNNKKTSSSTSPTIHLIDSQSNIQYSQTSVDVVNYDPNNDGILITATNSKFLTHRLYYDIETDNNFIQYSQYQYGSINEAKKSFYSEDFIKAESLENVPLRGILIVQKSATDLSDTTEAEFINMGSLGELNFDDNLILSDTDIIGVTEEVTADDADFIIIYDSTAGENRRMSRANFLAGISGAGESNTASNVGTAGVGVFKTKNGVNLEFKNINAGSNKITITDDVGNDEIDIDIAIANVDHDGLLNTHNLTTDINHENIGGLQGGTAGEYYHLTSAQHTDLTDSGDSSLHYHSSDRNRTNHTGTQTASTISDFDTEVSNNTDVSANTSHRGTTTGNPHSVTKTEVGLGNVTNDAQVRQDQLQTTITDDDSKVPTSGAVVDYVSGLGGGDMLKTTYDPTNVSGDAFAMDNMSEGTTNKILTTTERSNISNNTTHAGLTTGNPHAVTKSDVGLGNVTNEAQLTTAQLQTTITDDDSKVPSSGAVVDYVAGQIHDAVTVSDGTTIDFTLTGQEITGEVITGSVDHDALLNFVANEHLDWTGDLGVTNINDANITETAVTQHEGAINHDNLTNFVANEHIDWTVDNVTNDIHVNNISSTAVTQHEGSINHDNLTNFVANEHVNHTSVSVTTVSDSGLAGGGDITSTRNLSVDITGTTAETSIEDTDEILIYDNSESVLRKMTRANFVAGITGTGETNTASNVGTAGVGVFARKTGANLEFKNINTGSSKISITNDTGNDEIDVDVVEANITHNNIGSLQGGSVGEYYHLTSAQQSGLTSTLDTTLHFHDADRNRTNHTGTQTASTISDFDTEVSNNTDVSANTSARHSAVTVLDTATIDLTLTGQQVSGSVIESGLSLNNLGEKSYNSLTDKPNIGGIEDVTLTTIGDNEILQFNTTGSIWENKTLAEADIASASTLSTHVGTSNIHFTQGEISIPASQISDFDTEVSNNTDVSTNTSARHSAVTISDTSTIDFTLTGQQVSGSVIQGGLSLNNLGEKSYNSLTDKPSIAYASTIDLADLDDTTITSIATGELLKWSGTAWINNTLAEADVASASTLSTHVGTSTIHFTQGEISIPASQISDFDTEVSNNTDVSANTSARHSAVTVLDGSTIDFTLAGQQITAEVIPSAIASTSLSDTDNIAYLNTVNTFLEKQTFDTPTTGNASINLPSGTNPSVPVEGDLWYNGTNLYFRNSSTSVDILAGGGGGGETNTASNVGTAGVGVFKQKTGVDLEFKKINAGSSKVTITDDTGNSEVDIDVVPANILHSGLGTLQGGTSGEYYHHTSAQYNTNHAYKNTINSWSARNTFTKTVDQTQTAVTASTASTTVNWSTGSNKQKMTVSSTTTVSFTAPAGPASLLLIIVQNATGGFTVTLPATIKWAGGSAPTLTTTANSIDILTFYFDGTTYYGNYGTNYTV